MLGNSCGMLFLIYARVPGSYEYISIPVAMPGTPILCCHIWVCYKLMKLHINFVMLLSSLHLISLSVSVADLSIHRLCNTHTSRLPQWAELLEIMGVAWYASPERIVSRLSFLLERGTIILPQP